MTLFPKKVTFWGTGLRASTDLFLWGAQFNPKYPYVGFFFFSSFYCISLAVSGLGCGTQDLHYIMWDLWSRCTDSLAVTWVEWSQQAGTWLPRGTWDLISPTRDWTCVPCTARGIPNPWTTGEILHAYVLFPLFRHDLEYYRQPTCSGRIRTQIW